MSIIVYLKFRYTIINSFERSIRSLYTKSFRDLNNNLSISCGLVVRYHGVADLWKQENVKGVHVARKNKSINHSSCLNQTQTVRYLYTGRCIQL